MAAKTSRVVQCYHCRHRFEVGQSAESTNCPGCNQRVIVGDIVVKALMPTARVQTCGRVVVKKKGRINAELVEAHDGLEMLGGLTASVLCGGLVVIGPGAKWNGDCQAHSLEIKPGAKIEGGVFEVPADSLGLNDLPGRPVVRK